MTLYEGHYDPGQGMKVRLGLGRRAEYLLAEGPATFYALAILPGLTHYNIFASQLLAAAALSFLDAPRD